MSLGGAHVGLLRYLTNSVADMAYRVEMTDRAARDLAHLYLRIHAEDSPTADRWFNGLERAIRTLERSPQRCALAPEAVKTKRPLRNLLYGRKRHVYRVIYEIDDTGKTVRVLTIRHGAREILSEV
jgi:toxin ParE1/3/4